MTRANDGSAQIAPHQEAKTRPLYFGDASKPEIVWLVWTAGKLDDLESARSVALQADGTLRNETDVQKIRHFLERNKNNKLEIQQDDHRWGGTVFKGRRRQDRSSD